jgi:hypothetical protein
MLPRLFLRELSVSCTCTLAAVLTLAILTLAILA